jgi:hypothetical protein
MSEAANIPTLEYLQAVVPIQSNYLKFALLLGRTLPMQRPGMAQGWPTLQAYHLRALQSVDGVSSSLAGCQPQQLTIRTGFVDLSLEARSSRADSVCGVDEPHY